MENKKSSQKGSSSSSSSSITSQLFGNQESSDVFASIFPPKGVGRNSGSSEVRGSWQEASGSGNQPWNAKLDKHGEASYGSSGSKERSSIYQQEGADPSYLSSSLYYGGQEVYSKPSNPPPTSSYPKYKKDSGEDDAARGNWWQGSLYY